MSTARRWDSYKVSLTVESYVVKIKSSTSKGSVFMRVLGILEVVGGSRLSEHFRAG